MTAINFRWCAVTVVVFVSAFRYIVTVKRRNKTIFFAVCNFLKLQSEAWRFIRKRVGVHARHAALSRRFIIL